MGGERGRKRGKEEWRKEREREKRDMLELEEGGICSMKR